MLCQCKSSQLGNHEVALQLREFGGHAIKGNLDSSSALAIFQSAYTARRTSYLPIIHSAEDNVVEPGDALDSVHLECTCCT